MSSPRIVVVGSCVTDLISYSSHLPSPGETILGTQFSTGLGGKGGNQCVAATLLGGSTAMVGRVGRDTFGREYTGKFKELGINTEHLIETEGVATGAANIMVADDGQNCIVFCGGANKQITVEDVRGARGMVEAADVVVCQLEIPLEPTVEALKIAHEAKVITILNAAPGKDDLDEDIYKFIHMLCVNESEAELMTGMKLDVSDEDNIAQVLSALLSKGCRYVILTMGVHGAAFCSQEDPHVTCVPLQETLVTAVDCTGAGDAFIGAMAYYLAYHTTFSMRKIIENSCRIATVSVTRKGTQVSYANKDELTQTLFQ